jgi:hypothetical protein
VSRSCERVVVNHWPVLASKTSTTWVGAEGALKQSRCFGMRRLHIPRPSRCCIAECFELVTRC